MEGGESHALDQRRETEQMRAFLNLHDRRMDIPIREGKRFVSGGANFVTGGKKKAPEIASPI